MLNREMREINGMNIDVTTVMDKTVEYHPLPKECELAIQRSNELLDKYFVFDNDDGIRKMFNYKDGKFWKAKGWLISAMEKHPGYNGNYQIVLRDQDMNRHLNWEAITDFVNYTYRRYRETVKYNYNGKLISRMERDQEYDKFRRLRDKAKQLFCCGLYFKLNRKVDAIRTLKPQYDKNYEFFWELTLEVTENLKARKREMNTLEKVLVDDQIVSIVNEISESYKIKFKAVVGQALTRMIGKAANVCNIKKHVDIQDVSFYDQDGVFHSRQKDFGWNYQYAQFCDSVSPITLKATAVISVNYLDYWTMSFGKDWASCHTIDKLNKRNISSCTYEGMYCGGTESYMLDSSTIIFYFLPQNFNGNRPELEDKVKRCVFYLGEDKLVQSRVYPDGRDNAGDESESLAKDIRSLMQRVVSELFDAPNYWTNKKGTSYCDEITMSKGPHYRDYLHYDDCNVSYMKRIDGYVNELPILIGSESICPACGREHTTNDNIFCGYCGQGGFCKCWDCGDTINTDEAAYINGHWYCSDCYGICEDCEEPMSNEDETVVYYLNTYGNRGSRCVCEECRDRYYTWIEEDGEYWCDEDIVETEEGNHYCIDSDSFGVCDNCGGSHDIDNLHFIDYGCLCDDCYEEYSSEIDVDE